MYYGNGENSECAEILPPPTPISTDGKISAQPHTLIMYAAISYYHYTENSNHEKNESVRKLYA